MGKRKSSKKPQTRIKQTLDKSFRCVFCAHQGSVTCKMDTKNKVGRLDCKDCGQNFSMDINHLSEPVDIYSAWIDACEEANPHDAPALPRAKVAAPPPPSSSAAARKRKAVGSDDEDEEEAAASDEDDDDLPDMRTKKSGNGKEKEKSGKKGKGAAKKKSRREAVSDDEDEEEEEEEDEDAEGDDD